MYWKSNQQRISRQSGQQYVNTRGKIVPNKDVSRRVSCSDECKFKCSTNFTLENRQSVHSKFWTLSDREKFIFFEKTTGRKCN